MSTLQPGEEVLVIADKGIFATINGAKGRVVAYDPLRDEVTLDVPQGRFVIPRSGIGSPNDRRDSPEMIMLNGETNFVGAKAARLKETMQQYGEVTVESGRWRAEIVDGLIVLHEVRQVR